MAPVEPPIADPTLSFEQETRIAGSLHDLSAALAGCAKLVAQASIALDALDRPGAADDR